MKKLVFLCLLLLLSLIPQVSARPEIVGNYVILWEGYLTEYSAMEPPNKYYYNVEEQIELAGESHVFIEFAVSNYSHPVGFSLTAYGYDRFDNTIYDTVTINGNGVFRTIEKFAKIRETTALKSTDDPQTYVIMRHRKGGGVAGAPPPTTPPPFNWRPWQVFGLQFILIVGFLGFFPVLVLRLKKIKARKIERRKFKVIEKRLGRLKWKR